MKLLHVTLGPNAHVLYLYIHCIHVGFRDTCTCTIIMIMLLKVVCRSFSVTHIFSWAPRHVYPCLWEEGTRSKHEGNVHNGMDWILTHVTKCFRRTIGENGYWWLVRGGVGVVTWGSNRVLQWGRTSLAPQHLCPIYPIYSLWSYHQNDWPTSEKEGNKKSQTTDSTYNYLLCTCTINYVVGTCTQEHLFLFYLMPITCDMKYKFDTSADWRMMGVLEV